MYAISWQLFDWIKNLVIKPSVEIGIKIRIIFVKHFKTSTMNIKHLNTFYSSRSDRIYDVARVHCTYLFTWMRAAGSCWSRSDLDLESPEPGHASPARRLLGFQRLHKKTPSLCFAFQGHSLVHLWFMIAFSPLSKHRRHIDF